MALAGISLSAAAQIQTIPWPATDGLGRDLPGHEECGPPREGKFVGIFYFLWLGHHPQSGPHNISRIIEEPRESRRAWGPRNLFHWWEEPRFGYYLSNDEWVIARHAQMLVDAGVDVLIFDATNAVVYEEEYLAICRVFREVRAQGGQTPQIAFIAGNPINKRERDTTERIYQNFYRKNLYPELWFQWKGKPLILTDPTDLSEELLGFFTIRHSWAWSRNVRTNQPTGWFGDGRDKWPWLDHHPQRPGWHEDPSIPEQISVCVAQHPTSNIGRSFHNGRQPPEEEWRTRHGLCFQEQWERALEVDPEFVLVTGWNEWVAQRFISDGKQRFLGGILPEGYTYFVDCYNMEFSRDIEPMRGGYEDDYYYQMMAYIRRFKGVPPLPQSAGPESIAIDGNFSDWAGVLPEYRDDRGDVRHRDHAGFAEAGPYINQTGRNDIVLCKVTQSDTHLFFYVQTAEEMIFPDGDPCAMNLLLRIEGVGGASWEGYQFRIGRRRRWISRTVSLEQFAGNDWRHIGWIDFAWDGNEMELALPFRGSPETGPTPRIEFKWIDNMPEPLDILDFMDHGDAAPNGRFRYVFQRRVFE